MQQVFAGLAQDLGIPPVIGPRRAKDLIGQVLAAVNVAIFGDDLLAPDIDLA